MGSSHFSLPWHPRALTFPKARLFCPVGWKLASSRGMSGASKIFKRGSEQQTDCFFLPRKNGDFSPAKTGIYP